MNIQRGFEQFGWNGGRLSLLCELVGDGETYATIGRKVGCSRGAAIGRFSRLLSSTADTLHDDLFTRMLEDDWPLEAIAHHAKVSIHAIEARLAELRRALGPQAR